MPTGSKPRSRRSLESFEAAIAERGRSTVPASMREVHERYLGALALYENAAAEMVEHCAGRQGRAPDRRASSMSLRATEDMLRVGDVLWPGEYKPH